MSAQYQSSNTHTTNLAAGLSVVDHREIGESDSAISLIRYSDGSTWYFDNASGTRLDQVYGWSEANSSQEPAWFLTRERADEFDRDCGSILGESETRDADAISIADILP